MVSCDWEQERQSGSHHFVRRGDWLRLGTSICLQIRLFSLTVLAVLPDHQFYKQFGETLQQQYGGQVFIFDRFNIGLSDRLPKMENCMDLWQVQ